MRLQGAATICYLALHPDVKDVSGKYYANCNVVVPNSNTMDVELARKLWDFNELEELPEAEAQEVAEAASSTSPEVWADAGAERGRPRRWRCEVSAKASIYFFHFFFAFGWPMAYIPVDLDSFGATGCPRSRVR